MYLSIHGKYKAMLLTCSNQTVTKLKPCIFYVKFLMNDMGWLVLSHKYTVIMPFITFLYLFLCLCLFYVY